MKLVERNYIRVRDAAVSVGEVKEGLVAFCFTIAEIKKVTGFSHNTIKKYLSMMIEDKILRELVVSDSVTIYKFCKPYLVGIIGDRASTGKGF